MMLRLPTFAGLSSGLKTRTSHQGGVAADKGKSRPCCCGDFSLAGRTHICNARASGQRFRATVHTQGLQPRAEGSYTLPLGVGDEDAGVWWSSEGSHRCGEARLQTRGNVPELTVETEEISPVDTISKLTLRREKKGMLSQEQRAKVASEPQTESQLTKPGFEAEAGSLSPEHGPVNTPPAGKNLCQTQNNGPAGEGLHAETRNQARRSQKPTHQLGADVSRSLSD